MDLNKDYKQISVRDFKVGNYNALSGKIVDKVAFTNHESYDCQLFIITFTDKTFIAVGCGYDDRETKKDEPLLENHWVLAPQCINGGNYNCHSWVDNNGNVRFEDWINILRDLNIWEFDGSEALKIIEEDRKKKEEWEYNQYLRLKEKYEKKNDK